MRIIPKRYSQSKIWKRLSSFKIVTIGLLWLFVLTAWGTFYQVDYGLYAAQKRFFESFIFFAFDFFPLPGAALTLLVLFINMSFATLGRMQLKLKKVGVLLIHLGLMLMVFGGAVVHFLGQESFVELVEGEAKNYSEDYRKWELSVWQGEESSLVKNVKAIDLDKHLWNKRFYLNEAQIEIEILQFIPNARPVKLPQDSPYQFISRSALEYLQGVAKEQDPKDNLPGVIIGIKHPDIPRGLAVLLWAAEPLPVTLNLADKAYSFQLRRRHYQLPVNIELIDFRRELHPGTEIPKKFESDVVYTHEANSVETKIFMNNPLRFKSYTFYQASFGSTLSGKEKTILATVENKGLWIPYVSSLMVFLGFLYHFGGMLMVQFKKRRFQ